MVTAASIDVARRAGALPWREATLQFIGNATMLLRLNGIRVLTDPNFLHAGDHAHIGYGMTTRRLLEPAFRMDELEPVDAVLLSHYHGDHFDHKVEATLSRDIPILTTPHAATRLAAKGFRKAIPLPTWTSMKITNGPKAITVTAMPGKHGPGILSAALPQVMGSMIDVPRAGGRPLRLYISGDTLIFDELREIPRRFPQIDVAVIHLGGTRLLGALVTADAGGGVEAIRIIDPHVAIPVHYEEYTVMKSPLSDFLAAAQDAGLGDRVRTIGRGETFDIEARVTPSAGR
jgi:L-ascorbate metabolism protein UlaG (beta-lactamase superfamily)